MDDRNLMVIGVERRFVIVNSRFGTVALAPSLLPAVTTGHNRGTSVVPCEPVFSLATPSTRPMTGTSTLPVCFGTAPYSAFGGGVLPLAMRFETPLLHRVGLVASIDGGAVWFNQPIPVPAGTRFNFAARAGLDATLRVTNRTWLSAGYRHLHLSNAGLGATNPGIDAPMISVGLGWR
jgi:hypothetical protein